MESKLRQLFEFQKFQQDLSLQGTIDAVHLIYQSKELSMEDLTGVYAAGTPAVRPDENKEL